MRASRPLTGVGRRTRIVPQHQPWREILSARNAFPDVKVQLEDIVAEGDVVAARWVGNATHQGDGLGFPATGKPVKFTGMVFIRVENGKFVEGWNNFDQLGMLQQLGVVNIPG